MTTNRSRHLQPVGEHHECRTMTLDDGTCIVLHGADEEMPDHVREAFTTLVQTARDQHARQHADDPAVLDVVSTAVADKARTQRMTMRHVAEATGLAMAAVSRLLQGSKNLTVHELAALARWAGLTLTVAPADCHCTAVADSDTEKCPRHEAAE